MNSDTPEDPIYPIIMSGCHARKVEIVVAYKDEYKMVIQDGLGDEWSYQAELRWDSKLIIRMKDCMGEVEDDIDIPVLGTMIWFLESIAKEGKAHFGESML